MDARSLPATNKQRGAYAPRRVFVGRGSAVLGNFAARRPAGGGCGSAQLGVTATSGGSVGRLGFGLAANTANQALSGGAAGQVARLKSPARAGMADFCRSEGASRKIASFATRSSWAPIGQLARGLAGPGGLPPFGRAPAPYAPRAGQTCVGRIFGLAPSPSRLDRDGDAGGARNIRRGEMGCGVRARPAREASGRKTTGPGVGCGVEHRNRARGDSGVTMELGAG